MTQPAWQAFEREGKGSFRRERNARERARREGRKPCFKFSPSLPPSLRAPRVSLAFKTLSFSFQTPAMQAINGNKVESMV